MTDRPRKAALVILDGWGLSDRREGNAVALAATPVFDRLWSGYAHGRLQASGRDVGLPEGQFGNSEVGHLNLGAGFVVEQDIVRIDRAIEEGRLESNPALRSAVTGARERGAALHLIGLIGEGGVHAHSRHLDALLAMAAQLGPERVCVHAITDGRDGAPDAAESAIQGLQARLAELGVGRIATVGGRYFAMDRDRRWERTAKAWSAIVHGQAPRFDSALAALRAAYDSGTTDEFVEPAVIAPSGDRDGCRPSDGDAVVLFNFRADRMRQLLSALTEPDFDGFDRGRRPADIDVVTLTEYRRDQRARSAFPPRAVEHPIARVISDAGLEQFHAAETEKYAHVTYFFNGGREEPFEGEGRLLVPSPSVATYDLQPEMSAEPLTDGVVERLGRGRDAFLIINYANPDMVGHTGNLAAAVSAVETVDRCLGRLIEALRVAGMPAIVTADHGNCEQMIDPDTGGPHTAHTHNPVPVIAVEFERPAAGGRLGEGRLADIAPTLLSMLGLPAPDAMTGTPLCFERRRAGL